MSQPFPQDGTFTKLKWNMASKRFYGDTTLKIECGLLVVDLFKALFTRWSARGSINEAREFKLMIWNRDVESMALLHQDYVIGSQFDNLDLKRSVGCRLKCYYNSDPR